MLIHGFPSLSLSLFCLSQYFCVFPLSLFPFPFPLLLLFGNFLKCVSVFPFPFIPLPCFPRPLSLLGVLVWVVLKTVGWWVLVGFRWRVEY